MYVLRAWGTFCEINCCGKHGQCFANPIVPTLGCSSAGKNATSADNDEIASHVVIDLHVHTLRIVLNNFDIFFRDGHAVVLHLFDNRPGQRLVGRMIHHQERNLRLQPVFKLVIRRSTAESLSRRRIRCSAESLSK